MGRTASQEPSERLLSLAELTARVAMSVRTVRFYTSRGLVPAPIRQGRSGYYSRDHVARLELVADLQSHGFTLAAIERYVAGIPADASPEDIALRRAMLAPWQADLPVRMDRAELEARAHRRLDDVDLATLEALRILRPVPVPVPVGDAAQHAAPDAAPDEEPDEATERWEVAVGQLSVGLGLLDVGYPLEAAQAAEAVYAEHGRAIARELHDVFRTQVWPVYRSSGASPAIVRDVVERLKPLSINALVSAYEAGMDETKRAGIAERARRQDPPG